MDILSAFRKVSTKLDQAQSRYVTGGTAEMPRTRRVLSRILNPFFSRGLSLQLKDMSSGFRLYNAAVIENQECLVLGTPDYANWQWVWM